MFWPPRRHTGYAAVCVCTSELVSGLKIQFTFLCSDRKESFQKLYLPLFDGWPLRQHILRCCLLWRSISFCVLAQSFSTVFNLYFSKHQIRYPPNITQVHWHKENSKRCPLSHNYCPKMKFYPASMLEAIAEQVIITFLSAISWKCTDSCC